MVAAVAVVSEITTAAEVALQPFAFVTSTVYEPAAVAL